MLTPVAMRLDKEGNPVNAVTIMDPFYEAHYDAEGHFTGYTPWDTQSREVPGSPSTLYFSGELSQNHFGDWVLAQPGLLHPFGVAMPRGPYDVGITFNPNNPQAVADFKDASSQMVLSGFLSSVDIGSFNMQHMVYTTPVFNESWEPLGMVLPSDKWGNPTVLAKYLRDAPALPTIHSLIPDPEHEGQFIQVDRAAMAPQLIGSQLVFGPYTFNNGRMEIRDVNEPLVAIVGPGGGPTLSSLASYVALLNAATQMGGVPLSAVMKGEMAHLSGGTYINMNPSINTSSSYLSQPVGNGEYTLAQALSMMKQAGDREYQAPTPVASSGMSLFPHMGEGKSTAPQEANGGNHVAGALTTHNQSLDEFESRHIPDSGKAVYNELLNYVEGRDYALSPEAVQQAFDKGMQAAGHPTKEINTGVQELAIFFGGGGMPPDKMGEEQRDWLVEQGVVPAVALAFWTPYTDAEKAAAGLPTGLGTKADDFAREFFTIGIAPTGSYNFQSAMARATYEDRMAEVQGYVTGLALWNQQAGLWENTGIGRDAMPIYNPTTAQWQRGMTQEDYARAVGGASGYNMDVAKVAAGYIDTTSPWMYAAGLIPIVGTALWAGQMTTTQLIGSSLFDLAAFGGFLASGAKAISVGTRAGMTFKESASGVFKEVVSHPLAAILNPDKVMHQYWGATLRDWATGWGVGPDWMPNWVAGTAVRVPETVMSAPVPRGTTLVTKIFGSAPSKTVELQTGLRAVAAESLRPGGMFPSIKEYYRGLVESLSGRAAKAPTGATREGRYITLESPSGRIDLATTGFQDVLGGGLIFHASKEGVFFPESRGLKVGDKGLLYDKDVAAIKASQPGTAPVRPDLKGDVFDRTLEYAKDVPVGTVLEDSGGIVWGVERAAGYAPTDKMGKELVQYNADGSLGTIRDMFSKEALTTVATSKVYGFFDPVARLEKVTVPIDIRQGIVTGEKGWQSGLFFGAPELYVGFEDVYRTLLDKGGQPLLNEKGQPLMRSYEKGQRGGLIIRGVVVKDITPKVDTFVRGTKRPEEAAARFAMALDAGELEPGFYAVPRVLGPGRVEFEIVSWGVPLVPGAKARSITFKDSEIHTYHVMGAEGAPEKLSLSQAARAKALGEYNWIRDMGGVRPQQSLWGRMSPEDLARIDAALSVEVSPGRLQGDVFNSDGTIVSTATLGNEPHVGGLVRRDIAVIAVDRQTGDILLVQDKTEAKAGVHGLLTGGVDSTWPTLELNAFASAFSEGGFIPEGVVVLPPTSGKANPHAIKGAYVALVYGRFDDLSPLFGKAEITSAVRWDRYSPITTYAFAKDVLQGLKEAGFIDFKSSALRVYKEDWKGKVIADPVNRDFGYGTRIKAQDSYRVQTEFRMPSWTALRPEYSKVLSDPHYFIDPEIPAKLKNVGKASVAETFTQDFSKESAASAFGKVATTPQEKLKTELFQVSKVLWAPKELPSIELKVGENLVDVLNSTRGTAPARTPGIGGPFSFTWGLPGLGFGGIGGRGFAIPQFLSKGMSQVRGVATRGIRALHVRMKETAFSVGSGVKEATGRSASELSGGSTVSTGGKAAAVESVQALLERLATQEREESLMGRGVRDIDRIDEYERAYQNVRERQKEMVIPASAVAQLEYGMRALQYGGAYGRSGYGRGPVYGRPSYPGASLIPAPTYPGISREGEAPSISYGGYPGPRYPGGGTPSYPGKYPPPPPPPPPKIPPEFPPPPPRITTTTTTTDTSISYETRDKGQPVPRIRKKLKNDKKVILETRPVPYYAGTVDPRGATPWEVKQIAKVVAKTKEPGWKFDHWEGDVPMVDSHKNPVTLLMFKDRKISAVFTKGETIEPTGRKLKDVPIFMPKLVYEENVLERYEGNLPVGKKVHSGFRRRPAAYGEREAQTLRIKSEEI
jgi:hypothetical protein